MNAQGEVVYSPFVILASSDLKIDAAGVSEHEAI